jgi:hypothetical protein
MIHCKSCRKEKTQEDFIDKNSQKEFKTCNLCRETRKVKRIKCSVGSCENYAKKGGVCVKHGATNKTCYVENCENQAQKGGVCKKHGAKIKRCSVENCENQAQKGGVCYNHGAERKKCSVEDCENQARKRGVCIKHGAKHKRCSIENCENQAINGGVCCQHGATVKKCPHGLRPCYCRTCDFPKHPHKWCHSCTFVSIKNYKNKFFYPYCFHCYCVKFPDADIPRAFKLKEHYLRDELLDEYKEEEVGLIFDKKVYNGCSSKRPDVRIERYTHTIIIECDEHQHKNYECENKRMMEIFQDLGNRPIVFIRFNPDYYEKRTCFTKTPKTGQLKLNKTEWKKRIKVLKETIYTYFPVQDKNVQVVKLFYDDC